MAIFSADCDVRSQDESRRAFRISAPPPAAGYKLQHSLSRASPPSVPGQPHPGRRPDGVRSSQQVSGRPGSVSFAGPPARACQPPPATGPSAGGITSRQSSAGSPARYPTRGGQDCLSRQTPAVRLVEKELTGYSCNLVFISGYYYKRIIINVWIFLLCVSLVWKS